MNIMYENKKIPIIDCFTAYGLVDAPHIHKEIELIYVVGGTAGATVGNENYTIESGDLLVVSPYQTHHYIFNPQDCSNEFLVMIFPTHSLSEMEELFTMNDMESPVIHIEKGSLPDQFFRAMQSVQGPYVQTQICSYLNLALSYLIPTINWKERKPMENTAESILQYCSRHFTENITLDTISADLHLNKYYISHTINKYTNMNLNTIINSFRIELACRLLHLTDKKIAHIAQDVGYDSLRSFNRAFMTLNQLTPMEYRKQFKKQTMITEYGTP
ncbi:MAG: helix-turn-helix domain-containing protein [Clostridia bacterium]|nr:helix-turn-helix domain-containing protein [Clostridia bacterium]